MHIECFNNIKNHRIIHTFDTQTHYLVQTNSEYVVFGNENSILRVTMRTSALNHLVVVILCFLHVFAKNAVNWSLKID